MEKELSQLSKSEAIALFAQRIQELMEVSADEAKNYAERLYDYYSKFKVFPKTASTLDPSIKVLVGLWRNGNTINPIPGLKTGTA